MSGEPFSGSRKAIYRVHQLYAMLAVRTVHNKKLNMKKQNSNEHDKLGSLSSNKVEKKKCHYKLGRSNCALYKKYVNKCIDCKLNY